MPTLTVRRDCAVADELRKYRILLDGLEIGRLRFAASLRHEILEGPHVIQARIDWCGSKPLRFDATASDRTIVINSPLMGWRFFLLAPFVLLFDRFGYLTLEFDDDR